MDFVGPLNHKTHADKNDKQLITDDHLIVEYIMLKNNIKFYYINCSGIASGSKLRKIVSHVWIEMVSTHM